MASSNDDFKLKPCNGDWVTPLGRRLDAERVEHRRNQVDRVAILRADFALGLDAFRPDYHERVGCPPAIGLPLPATEWGVAGVGPAPGIVIEILRAAEIFDCRKILF